MKYILLLTIAVFVCALASIGQYRKSIPVKAGEDIARAFSPSGFYRFQEFSKGALYSQKISGTSGQLFNYDILADKIQFINRQGDTLDMTNPAIFDSVKIDNKVFYYNHELGFVELLAVNHPIRLVKKISVKIKPQTVGGYGGASSTSAVNRISTYVISTNVYTCKINEDVVVKENIDWFWIGRDGDLTKATRKNLFSLLPADKKDAAETLIKQQGIDFEKEDDLVRLVSSL